MKVALYARVSTAEEKGLQDPELQLVLLREWCKSNGHGVLREYVDHASGKSAEGRSAFKAVIESAEEHEVQGIVCLRLDRFMRDSVEGMVYCRRLQKAGSSLILVKDEFLGQIDTSTPVGEFVLNTIFSVGQLERRLTVERTKEGIAHYRSKHGEWGRRPRKDVNAELAAEFVKVKGLSETARLLGIPRNTLREHLARSGVDVGALLACRNTLPSKIEVDSNTPEQ